MILSEDDVRAYVREESGGKARWVEPALGSTPGLPDCWVPYEGQQVHFELKCGTLINGILRYAVRPEQRREIIAMKDDGIKVGLVIGVKGSKTVIFAKPTPEFLLGVVSLRVPSLFQQWLEFELDSKHGFWSGVNFIFSVS